MPANKPNIPPISEQRSDFWKKKIKKLKKKKKQNSDFVTNYSYGESWASSCEKILSPSPETLGLIESKIENAWAFVWPDSQDQDKRYSIVKHNED